MSSLNVFASLPLDALAGLVRGRLDDRRRSTAPALPMVCQRSEAFAEDLDVAPAPFRRQPVLRPLVRSPYASYVVVLVVALASAAGLLFTGAPIGV
jgi:hypothetical protein